MYQKIATATVIRGTKGCQAFVDGVARAEIRRQQDAMSAEQERARQVEASRDRLLARHLAELKQQEVRQKSALLRHLGNIWAKLWAMLICSSMALGLLLQVDDHGEH